MTAVDSAIEVLNSLPPASQIALTNYSTSVFRLNFRAVAQNLIDLKSETLFLLLQHMGLAEPQRFAFCLRDSIPANGDFVDTIIQRNFDPFTLQTSSNVNDVAFTDFVWHNAGRADAYELAVDPLMSGRYPAVADGSSGVGGFFVGLSRDDVGGLRYLLDTNNIKFKLCQPAYMALEPTRTRSWTPLCGLAWTKSTLCATRLTFLPVNSSR